MGIKAMLKGLFRIKPFQFLFVLMWSGALVVMRTLNNYKLLCLAGKIQAKIDDKITIRQSKLNKINESLLKAVYLCLRAKTPSLAEKKRFNILINKYELDNSRFVHSFPQRIEIELSSRCNLQCVMCRHPLIESPQVDLSKQLFEKIIPLFQYTTNIDLIGEGEPLLNESFTNFFPVIAQHQVKTRLFTNGVLLNEDVIRSIVEHQLTELSLSLPAASDNLYIALTKGKELGTVIANLRKLNQIKISSGALYPKVLVTFVAIKSNIKDVFNIIKLCHCLDIPTVYVGAGLIFTKELENESLLLYPEETNAIYREALALGEALNVNVELSQGFINNEESTSVQYDEPNQFGCAIPWQSVLIRATGKVEVCQYNRKIVGDLNAQDFPDIWNSKIYQAFRQGNISYKGINFCHRCYDKAFRHKRITKEQGLNYDVCFPSY